MPLPTFLIVGAQKSGTSSLVKTLRQHSQLQLSRPKELHFFDLRRSRGLDWYADHFTDEPGIKEWGESTPTYMYFRAARQGISEVLPRAKLVVMLRDPVRRAHSHFWHARRTGRESADTFEEGLSLEDERLAGTPSEQARFSYADRGFYIDQLEDLADRQGRENLHVMLLDDLKDARVPTLRGLFDFLGVDASQAHEIEEVWTYRYRSLASKGREQKVDHYQPMRTETKRRLAERFEPYTRRLEQWLDRDLSGWVRA